MEASLQTPSIESFSYSWLANLKPSSFEDSLIASDHDEGASFIEMDPRLPPSKRFIRVSSDFGFDFPVSDSPLGLVHADELISNGFLVPLFVKDVKMVRFDDEGCYMPTTTASTSEITVHSTTRVRYTSLRRCHRLSKRFFQKYVKFLLGPLLYRKRRDSSSSIGISSNRNWELSAATSPRTSLAYSADDNWRRSCDSESSIYEAVLHCKRTQGN
ncbi:putative membrane-associated kinase regulator 6 [Salvia divinorum]|uniref:Membrane-associated kinase regulator 6 n=1 Tax=Salvia divinorum TaxID=28513 RepID=A0ABD1H974_SALDI